MLSPLSKLFYMYVDYAGTLLCELPECWKFEVEILYLISNNRPVIFSLIHSFIK